MFDENDLRTACTTLAEQAPTIDESAHLIPSPDDARRSRRPVVLGAAAVATAAAVAVPTSLGVLRSDPPATPDPPATAGPVDDGFTIYRAFDLTAPAGWRNEERDFSETTQWATLMAPNGALCHVRVHEPGRFDARRIPAGSQPLTVNGKPGYFAEIRNPNDSSVPKGEAMVPDPRKLWTVVWRYDENAWALSICEGATPADRRQKEELMANATTFGREVERVPMRLGYVPAGFEPDGAGVRDPRINGGFQYDYDLDFRLTGTSRPQRQVYLAYIAGERLDHRAAKGTPLTINGRQATYDGMHLIIQGNGFQALIMAPYRLPGDQRSEMIRIAESLQFAPRPMDTGTWFDGAHALP